MYRSGIQKEKVKHILVEHNFLYDYSKIYHWSCEGCKGTSRDVMGDRLIHLYYDGHCNSRDALMKPLAEGLCYCYYE